TTDATGHKIIQEPGNRTIFESNNRVFIRHDEVARLRAAGARDFRSSPLKGGASGSSYTRPDGVRIEIEGDTYGRPLRRVRVLPDGRRFVLFQNRPLAIGLGLGVALGALIVDLPPPHYSLSREEYIVDADSASEDDIYDALYAPPVEALDRAY